LGKLVLSLAAVFVSAFIAEHAHLHHCTSQSRCREEELDAFRADPDWQKARDASETNGKIVAKIDSVFLTPTSYSGIK
jgi:NIPSNAP